MNPAEFYLRVIMFCQVLGASTTSTFRTRRHNQDVGGVAHSAHLLGLGADVTYDGTPDEMERRDWAERLGLKLLVEGDHDHLQPLDWMAG